MSEPLKILVCGSRDWADREAIRARLGEYEDGPPPTIIHGAASRRDRATDQQVSADMLADEIARQYGFAVEPFPADWATHGRGAGFIRNVQMLAEGPDLVIAFQRNRSRGTQHTIDQARKRGIPVEIITPNAR